MIQKQLHQPPPQRRSRSTTAPLPFERSPSPSLVIPGRARIRRVKSGVGPAHVIKGDSESSDEGRSVITVSSSGRSISDVEKLRSRTFPGVLDLSLDSSDESSVSYVEDANVDDADIGAWVHRKPVNLRPDYGDFGEAEEGDLIDRMLSRTVVSRRRTKKPTKDGTLNLPVIKRGQGKRKKPINIYVNGSRPHNRSRQLRIPDLFGTGQVSKRARDGVDRRSIPSEGRTAHGQFSPSPSDAFRWQQSHFPKIRQNIPGTQIKAVLQETQRHPGRRNGRTDKHIKLTTSQRQRLASLPAGNT